MRIEFDYERAAAVVALALLAGCGGDDASKVRPVASSEYADPRYVGGTEGGIFGENGLVLFANDKKSPGKQEGAALGVNAYLWRGALDTLSFMPLSSADPFGGVIITDWYQPPTSPGERFKATAYILGRELRTDGIRVAIFRQVQQGGQWTDATVSPTTTGDIENKVLERARELRETALANR